jgi:hypothetical protein
VTDLLDPGRRPPEAEIVDFLYAFFQSAYHLRDWLIKSPGVPPSELKVLFDAHRCLRLCDDIANASKHFVLDRRHETARIGLMREYVPPAPGSSTGGSRPVMLAFQDRKGSVEFVSIADLLNECMRAWREYCVSIC